MELWANIHFMYSVEVSRMSTLSYNKIILHQARKSLTRHCIYIHKNSLLIKIKS